MKSNIILDLDELLEDSTSIVILKKTGIKYTAQCGGVGCTHPEVEGFAINLGKFGNDFNDCMYGCSYIGETENEEMNLKLAIDFNKYSKEYFRHDQRKIEIFFDYERINELQESWIPIVINGKFDIFNECYFDYCKGFLHTMNCD
jgi:hypothetical protein